jgi:hypothetical protein
LYLSELERGGSELLLLLKGTAAGPTAAAGRFFLLDSVEVLVGTVTVLTVTLLFVFLDLSDSPTLVEEAEEV